MVLPKFGSENHDIATNLDRHKVGGTVGHPGIGQRQRGSIVGGGGCREVCVRGGETIIVEHDLVFTVGEIKDAVETVQGSGSVVDPEAVRAGAAGQMVRAVAASQGVGPCTTAQRVSAVTATQVVGRGTTGLALRGWRARVAAMIVRAVILSVPTMVIRLRIICAAASTGIVV